MHNGKVAQKWFIHIIAKPYKCNTSKRHNNYNNMKQILPRVVQEYNMNEKRNKDLMLI